MDIAHGVLAYAAIGVVGVGFIWSLLAFLGMDFAVRTFDRLQAIAIGVFLVASLAGGWLLISGGQPNESLHLVYAAVAIGLIPLSRSFVPGRDRRAPLVLIGAFVVLALVLYRLFTTG